tara:strand:- start:590 stop:778 length:189 start_codon:yes stop_codon:yes gene_type:complete
MSKSCKPAADHEYRSTFIPESQRGKTKRVSLENQSKRETRREIESRLEQRQIERELSLEYVL